jgi:hypothetical protein
VKRVCFILAVCLIVSLPGLAQQIPADVPATQADVEKYLATTHVREMVGQMMDAMTKPMDKMVHEEYLKHKDVLPPDYENHLNKIMHDMLTDMPWEQIIQAMVPAYQKHFTKADMEALTAFYSTPTGQKVLREMPGLMADSMEIMMPLIQQHVEKVTARMQDELTAMMKDAEKPSPAPKKK